MTDANRTDRLVRLDGTLLFSEDLTPDEAREKHKELVASRTSFRHHRYAGKRVGWISVCGWDFGEEAAPA